MLLSATLLDKVHLFSTSQMRKTAFILLQIKQCCSLCFGQTIGLTFFFSNTHIYLGYLVA